MGAPGTQKWIAAQREARRRLRREWIAHQVGRAFIGLAVVAIALSIASAFV